MTDDFIMMCQVIQEHTWGDCLHPEPQEKGCEQGVYIFTAGWGWDCRGREQSILFILEGPGRQQKMQTRWEAELEPRSVCR